MAIQGRQHDCRPGSPRRHAPRDLVPDGTVVLRLRMAAGAGIGDVEMRHAPGSADYGRVRKRLPLSAPGMPPVYDDWD